MYIKLRADEFKRRMITKGFSQRNLASVSGVSFTTINYVVNGKRDPGPATARKLCDALGCEFDEIFFIEEDSKSYQTSTA